MSGWLPPLSDAVLGRIMYGLVILVCLTTWCLPIARPLTGLPFQVEPVGNTKKRYGRRLHSGTCFGSTEHEG